MSRRANPTAIGLFVLGAIVLAIVGVGAFASSTLFRQEQTFISYFDESVNGLAIGSPVKFKGVPIGRVTEILLRMDLEGETFQVPVLYEIDLAPLTDATGTTVDLANRAVLREQVEDGLRAQLQMESFLTSQLYIELSFFAAPEPVTAEVRQREHPEIPTVLSPMARIGEEASGLVANLRRFDVNTINENLITLLAKANQKLDDLDVASINESLVDASQSIEDLAEAPEMREAMKSVPEMSQQFTQTLTEMQATLRRLSEAVDPATQQLERTSETLVATLQQMQKTMEQTRLMLSTDSGVGFHMEDALANLSEAAEALRLLAVSLERNPSMFIRGKDEPQLSEQ